MQVVTNLLLNALDATAARGQVILHLYPAPHWLCEVHKSSGYCISIADSGSGIAPQDRAQIYHPFFTTKGERGTGLGLWVSAGIINRIGGSIRVWSTCRPGRSGTCFSVFLPAKQTDFILLNRPRRGVDGRPTQSKKLFQVKRQSGRRPWSPASSPATRDLLNSNGRSPNSPSCGKKNNGRVNCMVHEGRLSLALENSN